MTRVILGYENELLFQDKFESISMKTQPITFLAFLLHRKCRGKFSGSFCQSPIFLLPSQLFLRRNSVSNVHRIRECFSILSFRFYDHFASLRVS